VVVADAPGFVVNRILMPYLGEALVLLEEGYAIVELDAAMRRFGMPMGPFELLDEIGLDVAQRAAGSMSKAFPDRAAPSTALATMVEHGRLGKKNGLGFYRHRGRKRTPDPQLRALLGLTRRRTSPTPDALSERMVLAMINEAALCLGQNVVTEAGWIDLAMILGSGFPPFRGGVLRYADSLGLAKVASRLGALRAEKGDRFQPAPLLTELAASGGTFTAPIVTG